MTTGRKEDYQGKGGRLSSEARKITKGSKEITNGRKQDYQGKEGRLPKQGRKSTKGSKEIN